VLSTDWEDTLKELNGETGFNTGLDISLSSDGTKLALIHRDKETINLNEGNTEIKVYDYNSSTYDLASPENIATHTYSGSYTVSGIDSTDDGRQVVAVLSDQTIQKFSLSETNVLTYDTPFSFGPLGGTGDLTMNLSHDGSRVFVFQPGAPCRIYDYTNLGGGYYTMSTSNYENGIMSKDGRRFVIKTSQGIETFDVPVQAPNGVVVLERIPASLTYAGAIIGGTPLALSFDGNLMLGLHSDTIKLYVWSGVMWKEHVVVASGSFFSVADVSRDGTYVIVGGYGASGEPVKTFKWNTQTETYDEYGGTTLYTVTNATSLSINQNGDKAVVGTSSNASLIYTLADKTWNRRTTVSGTTGEGKAGCVSAANEGRAFATASDTKITFFGDFTVRQYPIGWSQRGNAINIPDFVRSISLSDDGNYIVAGLYKQNYSTIDGPQTGSVRVFQFKGSSWSQRGGDVVHSSGNSNFGYATAISPDGTKFAAGGNGLVRVFTNQLEGAVNLKNTISSIPLTPLSGLFEISGDGQRVFAHTQTDSFEIFDGGISTNSFLDGGSAIHLSNNGSYLAVERDNVARVYGINSQAVVSLIGTSILPSDSSSYAGAFRLTTANASAKININTADTGLINLATSYASITEICSLTYDPNTGITTRTTTNHIVTDDSSEINGFLSHHGIAISRDGATLVVYDNTKFSVYSFANSTWTFVRTKTVTSGPYIVILSYDGSRVAYRDGGYLRIENTATGVSLGSISVTSLYTYAFKDNTTLALLQGTNDIELYEYDGVNWTLGETLTYSGTNASSRLRFSGDGDRLAAGDSYNRSVTFFDYDSSLSSPVTTFVQDGSAHSASVLALSGDGAVKVIGTSTDVEIIEASGTTTFTGAATSVDVSSDGTRVVVGTSTKMYVINKSGGVWAQLGSDIAGNAPEVAISPDGSKIFSNDGALLKSYEFVSGSWTTYLPNLTTSYVSKISTSTDGDVVATMPNVYSRQTVTTSAGYSFSLSTSYSSTTSEAVSGNGLVRAIANKYANNSTGEVVIYEKVNGAWSTTAAATFTGASATEEFGRDVKVSKDGTRVVIGSGTKMVVVEKSGGTWSQLGSDISGSTTKVAISRDGSKVFNYDGSSLKSYELVSGSWTQYLPDLTSLSNISAVQASTDGDIVALSRGGTGTNQVYSKQNVTASGGYSISQAATLSNPNGSRISENGSVLVTYDNEIYEKDSNGNWPSTPSATFTSLGFSLAVGVSDDGTRVAMQSANTITVVEKVAVSTTTYTVTVASVGGSDRYHIDGVDRPQLTFYRGNTYIFDLSDSSNSNHPLGFVTASGPYTDGVSYSDSGPGSAGSQVTWTVPATAPSTISYYCAVHGTSMGTTNTVTDPWAQIGSDITGSFIAVTGSCMTGDGTKVFGSSAAQSGGTNNITQIGSDINGEAFDDSFGRSVSMNSDGTRVAIGAPLNDGTGNNAGHVRVYAESGGTWTQIGDDIDGERATDYSGLSVSISSDGTRVAIGAYGNDILGDGGDLIASNAGHVRVYEESGGTWTQVGSDIEGEAAVDYSGSSVSISSDGTRVAIGAYLNDGTGSNAGHVRVYEESGGTWTQVGTDINGEVAGDQSGRSVSMSSDGTRVAIGAPYNDGAGPTAGHVRVYEESGGTWTQVGTDIDGEAAYDSSGFAVSISSDGTRVAIGASYNDGNGASAGHVRVYEESGGTWTQVGSDIDGEAADDRFGTSVSISSDGTRVVIGATGKNDFTGYCQVYEESGGTWTQVGSDIDGYNTWDSLGQAVAVSGDGTRIAIGAIQGGLGDGGNGFVSLYSLPSTTTQTATSSWEYSGSGWSQYRPDITSSQSVTRISHSTNGEILGLEDANKVIIYATTSSGSSYSKRHADASYLTSYHSLSDDGAQLISRGVNGSRSWNGTNYVYDGASATQTIWGPSTGQFIEVSGNGNLVFHVDDPANNLKLYSKSISNGNVSWTLQTNLAFTYYPVLVSGLASDAIVVTGSGSAGAKIYDVTYTPGGTTTQYATRGSSFSGYQIGMSDDGSKVVSTSYQKTSTAWNGTDYAYDGANANTGAPWLYWSGGDMDYWGSYETNRRVYLSGDGNRVLLVADHAEGIFSDVYVQMFYRITNTNSTEWSSTDVTHLTFIGTWGDPSINTTGDFFGIVGSFYDILYDPETTSDQYAIRGTGLGFASNHALSEDGNYVVYTYGTPGAKAWNGTSWAYNGPTSTSPGWSTNHSLLALSGDATKAIAFKSTTNEVIFYTKDAQHQWSQSVTLTQAGVTALSIDTDGSIVGVAANGQTKFYTFGSTQSPIGWVSHSSIQDQSVPNFAQSFDISNDGDAVVVGAPGDGTSSYRGEVRVYDYASSSWTPRTTITPPSETGAVVGEVGYRNLGKSVSISDDGVRIAYLGDRGDYSYSYSLTSTPHVQVGSDIDGEAAYDYSGHSVSMSSDGTRVAIGAWRNDNNSGYDAGHVRVYAESGGTWTQVGSDIDGEAAYDYSGWSVSMSSDGTRVAIGAYGNDGNGSNAGHVRVYEESSGTWTQVGSDIDGDDYNYNFGHSVSMSSDGTRVAIGGHLKNYSAGHVRVYEESGGTWTQVGSDIDGEAFFDWSGYSVSMSSDGTRVAIGAYGNDGNGNEAGHVRVYAESSGTWTQLGSDIDGEAAGDRSGWSVSMSSDGTRVAIGAIYNDGTGSNAGHVRVYEESGGTWTQVGSDIDGEAALDNSGWSVSMSSDGTRVAIGAYLNDGNGNEAGHVRVYAESGGTWTLGSEIDGEAVYDQSGYSVSMSSDGSRVAIGARVNDGNGANAGHVRVYSIASASLTTSLNLNRSEASTRDWENSAWVNPAYATDDVTSTEIVPAAENRDLATIAMSYDGTRFGVRAESGSYDAIVKKLDILVLPPVTNTLGWTKRGGIITFNTIDSVDATSSRSFASSSDGNTVAFAYVNSSGVKIRIYGYASGAWAQLGSEISTTGTTVSIDLSENGSRLAVLSSDTGRVYAYNSVVWSQLGSSIAFRPTGIDTIKINGNGNYVALGNNAPSDPYPFNILQVYRLEDVDWELVSPTMTLSKNPTNYFGSGFGVLNDGRLVHLTDSGVEFASFVTTETTEQESEFVQHLSDITGNGVGSSLAFDESGDTLVTGSFTDSVVRVFDSGHNIVTTFDTKTMYADIDQPFGTPEVVNKKPFAITKDGSKIVTIAPPTVSGLNAIVYKKQQGGVWVQDGNTIGIAATSDRIAALDITNDGTTIAVGSIEEAQYGTNPCPGRTQAFTLSSGTWSQLGSTITNPEGNHRFSNVVAISDVGTIVIGGHYTYNGGRPFGVLKTYERKDEILDISFGTPTLQLIGNSYKRLPLNAAYQELGATVTTQASTIPEIKITGNVQTGVPGVYTLRYECEDILRKKAAPVTREVEIISAIPSFRIKGEPLVYHTLGVAYDDPGVEIFSGYEGATSFGMFRLIPGQPLSPILTEGSFTPNQEGDYTITWVDQLVDKYIRSGTTQTRTVRVRERPVITLTGASLIYHRLGDPYVDQGVTITQSSYGFKGTTRATAINPNLIGVYTITYSALDKFGIEALPVTRTVEVKARPVINITGIQFYRTLNDPLSLPPVTVTTPEGYASDLTPSLQSTNDINTNSKGNYTIQHTLTDPVSGISADSKSQRYSVGTHGTLSFSELGSIFAYNGSSVVVYDTAIRTYNIQADGSWSLYSTLSVPSTPTAMKMTNDGQYLVIGMSSHLNIGITQVYKRNKTFQTGWEQVGFDVFGTDYLGKFGDAVDINSDGSRIVVGAPEAGTSLFKSGSVKIYDWSGFFWNQTKVIEGTITSEFLGFSVSFDGTGTSLAIGSPGHSITTIDGSTVTTTNVGKTSVYKLGASWNLFGSEIDDGPTGKRNGTSVSISQDGRTLAVGSTLGGARVYELNDTWTLKGSQILPNVGGKSVSLLENIIAIGSEDEAGGRVYIYTYSGSEWSNATESFDKVVVADDTTLLGKQVALADSGTSLCAATHTGIRIYKV
jgi:hypothetical protein